MEIFAIALQVIVALGLLNVWILRFNRETPYRGKDARSMREEFAAYGLPPLALYMVGGLKILASLALLLGIWLPALVLPAAAIIVLLMLGALAMHLKVGDPAIKSVPALTVLLLTAGILLLRI